MVWRSLSDIAFSDAKHLLLVGCRVQLRKKGTEFDSKVLHSFKNCKMKSKKIIIVLNVNKFEFLFEKIDENIQFNSLFLRNSKKNYLCPRKAGYFFIWGLKKVVVLKQFPLYGLRFRDAWKGSMERTDGIKRACPCQQGTRFRAWPIYAGLTAYRLMITWLLANT